MITVTSNAIDHIKEMISSRDKNTLGVKVGISTKGCSGLSYTMQFVDRIDSNDEILTFDDVKIFNVRVYDVIFRQKSYIVSNINNHFKIK